MKDFKSFSSLSNYTEYVIELTIVEGLGGRKVKKAALCFTSAFCNFISFQLGPGELGMRKAYYTQNTSDDRTVSKKTRSSQKERKLKMLTFYTRPPERAPYFKGRFDDL